MILTQYAWTMNTESLLEIDEDSEPQENILEQ